MMRAVLSAVVSVMRWTLRASVARCADRRDKVAAPADPVMHCRRVCVELRADPRQDQPCSYRLVDLFGRESAASHRHVMAVKDVADCGERTQRGRGGASYGGRSCTTGRPQHRRCHCVGRATRAGADCGDLARCDRAARHSVTPEVR